MIAVPSYRAGNVKGYLVGEKQHRGNFVGNLFGWVKMTVVKQAENVVLCGIVHVKFMRADGVAFKTDAENL